MIPPIRLHTVWPRLLLQIELPQVLIDPSEALADFGLRPIGEVMKDEAQQGQNAILEYIAQTAREGDRLAQVEVSNNVIAELAKAKWPDARELNVDYAPKHRVDIVVQEGRIEGFFQRGRVIVDLPHVVGTGRNLNVLNVFV